MISWENGLSLLLIISIRYFLIAGVAYLIWYRLLRKKLFYKKIQARFPKNQDYKREIAYSISTIVIFAAVPFLLLQTPLRQFTRYYTHLSAYSTAWFFAAFPIMFIVHDTYFYWMHRLMHHKLLFRHLHLVHHKSVNPSPWAAFAFQPAEAALEAGIFVILILLMPLHLIHLFVFFLVMMVYNVYGHLGWELYPANFNRHWLGRYINTSVNHNQHHQHFKGNYGLYFLFWDRLMGTLRSDYDKHFDRVSSQVSPVQTTARKRHSTNTV